ncbi:MAG TPA: 16S rRNA (guanine(966)-N(2))-methyltransferase RsmD [Gemmatimonadaceae bacterium]|nr:16S rRNA (guanine(966)-N(2))-methyltransferase RsmD [Gemmatimonadaceae bacterium]
MRIVAGRWRGRRIQAPPGAQVRPTADRVREAWLSIVQLDLPDALVLDLFAGSGALGLEALSRGARRVDFVEANAGPLRVLRENLETLGVEEREAHVHRGDAMRFAEGLGGRAYDVCFADPPYHQGLAERLAELWLDEPFSRVLGLEHESGARMPEGGSTRRYGGTALTFYRLPWD